METENKMEQQILMNDAKEQPCVIFKDPDDPFDPLITKVTLAFYEMVSFDVAEGTVQVVFELSFAYKTELFNDVFGNITDSLPWFMPNAVELDVGTYLKYNIYGLDIDSLNAFSQRQKFDKDAKLTLFTVEIYTLRATLKVITFPSEDPFQSMFLVFKLACDSTPGSSFIRFKAGKGYVILRYYLFSFRPKN